jgi:hypothetical protein
MTNENGELTLPAAWCQTQTVVMDGLRLFYLVAILEKTYFSFSPAELMNYSMSKRIGMVLLTFHFPL